MATSHARRFITCALAVAAAVALPRASAAQSTTTALTLTFDRSGTPGTETIPVVNPITGQAVADPITGEQQTFTRDTGAFANPCVGTFVDVRGTTNITVTTSKTSTGALSISVASTTKATGSGWTSPDNFATIVPTGTTYAISASLPFTTTTLPGQAQASDVTDRFVMRGQAAGDLWIVRVTWTLVVDTLGHPSVTIKEMKADPACKVATQ